MHNDINKKEPNGSSCQDDLGVAVEGCGQGRQSVLIVHYTCSYVNNSILRG